MKGDHESRPLGRVTLQKKAGVQAKWKKGCELPEQWLTNVCYIAQSVASLKGAESSPPKTFLE